MKNKPDSKICFSAGSAKKNMLILVNLVFFYLKLTFRRLLGNKGIIDRSFLDDGRFW